jgi:hypothetical protein
MIKKILFLMFILTIPAVVFAAPSLDQINQKVCDRFEEDLSKLAAIMEEVRRREGILETTVAFGGVDTPIEIADYQITYAAEALAFQKARKNSSVSDLKSSLLGLKSKILQAKKAVGGVLNE